MALIVGFALARANRMNRFTSAPGERALNWPHGQSRRRSRRSHPRGKREGSRLRELGWIEGRNVATPCSNVGNSITTKRLNSFGPSMI
jgi:hypothetical protein